MQSPASLDLRAIPGRELELRWLGSALAACLRGSPRVVFVHGEAGIGKSRLAREVTRAASRGAALTASARAVEGVTIPYLVVLDLLRSLERSARAARIAMEESLLPALLRPAPAPPPSGAGPGAAALESGPEQTELFGSVTQFVLGLARQRPSVLVVDDLHWCDEASLRLLAHLIFDINDAAALEPLPILIVAAYREPHQSAALARFCARLSRETSCESIELSGLDEASTRRMCEQHGLSNPGVELVAMIQRITDGNPLFIETTVAQLKRKRALVRQSGAYRTTQLLVDGLHGDLLSMIEIHPDLTSAMKARLQTLEPQTYQLLTVAAFVGMHFDPSLLAGLCDETEAQVRARLEALDGLVTPDGFGYAFAHPIIRHVLYAEPSKHRREMLHATLASALEQRLGANITAHVWTIARHLIDAGAWADRRKLCDYAIAAADQALSMCGWSDAARAYAAAAAVVPNPADRARLSYQAGTACLKGWDWDAGLRHFETALCAFQEIEDHRGAGRAMAQRIRTLLPTVPFGTLADISGFKRALGHVDAGDAALRSTMLVRMADAYWYANQPRTCERYAKAALEAAAAANDTRLSADAYTALGLARMQMLQMRSALRAFQSASSVGADCGDATLFTVALGRVPITLQMLGALPQASRENGTALAQARATSDHGETSLGLANATCIATALGRFEEAESLMTQTMASVARSKYPWGGYRALLAEAQARHWRGDAAEAKDALCVIIEPGRVFERAGDVTKLIVAVLTELIDVTSGHSDSGTFCSPASQQLRLGQLANTVYALPGGDPQAVLASCAIAELAEVLDDPALAQRGLPLLRRALGRGMKLTHGWCVSLDRVVAMGIAGRDKHHEARRHFERALRLCRKAGARPELARTLLEYARFLIRTDPGGGGSASGSMLEEAAALAASLRMPGLLHNTLRLADVLGMRVELRPASPTTLQAGELDLLRRISRGQSEGEIAHDLALSAGSISTRIERLLVKLNAEKTSEAMIAALESGIVSAPDLPKRGKQPLILMVTDMVGFSTMVDRLGDVAAQRVMRLHNAILRSCIHDFAGQEVTHTGDGMIASFRSAPEAIACACSIQLTFAQCRRRNIAIHVRIGLNAGDPLREEERLFGGSVNAAVRLCSVAAADEIVASKAVVTRPGTQRWNLSGPRSEALKGIQGMTEVYAVKWVSAAATATVAPN